MLLMSSPYSSLPDHAFWSRSVARLDASDVDPVVSAPFAILPTDKVATAGSCFAQHIAKALVRHGFSYLITEAGEEDRNFGVFSARFGNLYTVRQLLQLFDRAYALFEPAEIAWKRPDGALVDPFRQQVEPAGFQCLESLLADRESHLAAVRDMFETCDVFVFTLGLTEGWESPVDRAVFPLAPGVVASPDEHGAGARFINFSVADMVADLGAFISKLRSVNPEVRILLTVSPVPLIATYEPRHVLCSTIYSKSALRVVAEEISRSFTDVGYFPSYEIIIGHHNGYRHFEPDLRGIRPEGVDNVMRLFFKHYASAKESGADAHRSSPGPRKPADISAAALEELTALSEIVCDEEAIEA